MARVLNIAIIALTLSSAANAQPNKHEIAGLKANHWYALANDTALPVVRKNSGESSYNIPRSMKQLVIPKDTEFSLLRFSRDGNYVLIGIERNLSQDNPGVRGRDPVIVWAKKIDIVTNLDVKDVDIETNATLAHMGIDAKKPVSSEMEDEEPRQCNSAGKKMSYCLRDVRIASVRFGRTSVPQAEMASKAMPKYVAAGWIRTNYSSQLPLGSVCFFSGGRLCGRKEHCGHAAIKIQEQKWAGAGVFDSPFLRNHRFGGRTPYRLQGCVVPPSKANACLAPD